MLLQLCTCALFIFESRHRERHHGREKSRGD